MIVFIKYGYHIGDGSGGDDKTLLSVRYSVETVMQQLYNSSLCNFLQFLTSKCTLLRHIPA
jgi:hypothetical protein